MKSFHLEEYGLMEMSQEEIVNLNGGMTAAPVINRNSTFYKVGVAIGKTIGEVVGGTLVAVKFLFESGALSPR